MSLEHSGLTTAAGAEALFDDVSQSVLNGVPDAAVSATVSRVNSNPRLHGDQQGEDDKAPAAADAAHDPEVQATDAAADVAHDPDVQATDAAPDAAHNPEVQATDTAADAAHDPEAQGNPTATVPNDTPPEEPCLDTSDPAPDAPVGTEEQAPLADEMKDGSVVVQGSFHEPEQVLEHEHSQHAEGQQHSEGRHGEQGDQEHESESQGHGQAKADRSQGSQHST